MTKKGDRKKEKDDSYGNKGRKNIKKKRMINIEGE